MRASVTTNRVWNRERRKTGARIERTGINTHEHADESKRVDVLKDLGTSFREEVT
jgi:hypothetical protein